MRQTVLATAALAGSLVAAALAQAQGDALTRQEIRDALQVMTRQLDSLHEEIINSLSALGARETFIRAQNVLGNFVQMSRALDRNASMLRLQEDYARADEGLRDLLEFVEGLGPSYAGLHRAAARVRVADRELHYAVFGELPGAKGGETLGRQSRGLLDAAYSLEKASAYALAGVPTARDLLAEEKQFVRAVREFDLAVKDKTDQAKLRELFREVLDSWDHVVLGLRRLPQGDHVYLMRTANRVDSIHERLFRILAMTGKRTRVLPAE